LRDEAATLFLAGHETTANALNWTFYLLAKNPQAEEKLHTEVDSVLAGRTPTLADLANLPYTEMLVKEAMRLYPPIYAVSRMAIEDTLIGPYTMPKGVVVAIIPYATHHDERWWPESEAFKPERFAPENEANLNKHAYLPFITGPRVCICQMFAMMEARLLVAMVAQQWRLSLEPGQVVLPDPALTLRPKGGLTLRLHKRQSETQAVQIAQPVLA